MDLAGISRNSGMDSDILIRACEFLFARSLSLLHTEFSRVRRNFSMAFCAHRAVNPELFSLLVRVKAVYMMCGGDSGMVVNKKQMKAFDYKKSILVNRLVQLDNVRRVFRRPWLA